MKWNEKTVKAIVYNREKGQREQQTLSPKEIIDNPIGKEPEVIIMACCKVMSELVAMKEAELDRINSLMHDLKAPNTKVLHQLEMPLEQ